MILVKKILLNGQIYNIIKRTILGMNASSISEITGIPRATVIRKLRISEKKGMIHKDKQQLYTIGKIINLN